MKRTAIVMEGKVVWDPPFTPEEETAQQARFDEMLESGVTPFLMTDNVFLEGRCNGNQFEKTPGVGDFYRRQAQAAGVNPKGKVYVPTMAEYPGDPRAWVSDRHDVQKACEERGYDCDGAVTVRARPQREFPKVEVADDLVELHTDRAIEKDPALALKPRAEVKDQVFNKIRPKRRSKS